MIGMIVQDSPVFRMILRRCSHRKPEVSWIRHIYTAAVTRYNDKHYDIGGTRMKKRTKFILAALLALVLASVIGGYAYLSDYYHASSDAVEAMAVQEGGIQVEQDGSVLWFVPEQPTAGLIFYPGGKVEYTAYAPLMRAFAQQGILCGLVKMPGTLAVLSPNAADGLQQVHPEITSWYIGGHSLGGAMAASYAAKHAADYTGLILLAAYSTKDLTGTSLRVLSIYGSEDGVMNRDSYESDRANLPSGFTEVVIEGGCHAQFGSYGPQKGDGTPTISGAEQIRQTAACTAEFIASGS